MLSYIRCKSYSIKQNRPYLTNVSTSHVSSQFLQAEHIMAEICEAKTKNNMIIFPYTKQNSRLTIHAL